MRLSKLQKFILELTYFSKNKTKLKSDFYIFYKAREFKKNKIKAQVALQNSLDNLVFKNLIVAYGHKTAKKWTINKIKLTARGSRLAKEIIKKRQRQLPIK